MGGGTSKTTASLQRFDANGDGQLDAAEQSRLVDDAVSAGADRGATERLLAAADADGDGKIDEGELAALGKSADALASLGSAEPTEEPAVAALKAELHALKLRPGEWDAPFSNA